MELEKNCQICKKVDFLLFNCKNCNLDLCNLDYNNHNCIINQINIKNSNNLIPIGKQSCSFYNCSQIDILVSTCRNCNLIFCLSHRHPPDHQCSKIKEKDSKPIVIKKSYQPALKSKKRNPKVELMKLKLNAKGSDKIPVSSRAYFNVVISADAESLNEYPLYFDNRMPIGRIVDTLATDFKIVNLNNTDQTNRLGLYSLATGKLLPMSSNFETLFKDSVVQNGSTIIFERSSLDNYNPSFVIFLF
ncbi:hypothetical protein BC833DRAFT_609131 [Globomyces pollinis-pini]|nr:hypothetical protein BC833DRAFT_609131 [Globomyces pollinis-pini]